MYSYDNEARQEEMNVTIKADNRLIEAYKKHPKRVIVESYKDFNEKIKHVIKGIEQIIKE